MDAASSLLSSQLPSLCGLYSTLLGQNLSFPVTRESFIQILNAGGNHWITVQHTQSFSVNVFDSKFSTIPMDVKMQIAALLCCSSSRITTRFHKTLSQIGSSDCGVFAIAFATDFALGSNPASHHNEQNKLRPHFIECLKSEQMTPFPSKTSNQESLRQSICMYMYTVTAAYQTMVRNGWLSTLVARNGTTSHLKTFPKQYLKLINDCKCKVCIAREKLSA